VNGEVTPDREAVLRVTIRGPGGLELETDAILDTGFTDYFSIESSQIAALGLPHRGTMQFELANGTLVPLEIHRGEILWNGQWRSMLVTAAGGAPLIGMSLLAGSRVTLNVIDGGPVTIEPLP
jgi:predicted aspartyl protease